MKERIVLTAEYVLRKWLAIGKSRKEKDYKKSQENWKTYMTETEPFQTKIEVATSLEIVQRRIQKMIMITIR